MLITIFPCLEIAKERYITAYDTSPMTHHTHFPRESVVPNTLNSTDTSTQPA